MSDYSSVPHDAEFERILRLPRRVWTKPQMREAADLLTPQLLNERGLAEWRRCWALPAEQRDKELDTLQIRLQMLQAVGLIEAHALQGLFASMSVGRGKTLLTWLLPFMFPHVRLPVLMLPGGLKQKKDSSRLGKTEQEFARIRKFWKTPDYPVQLVSYELWARKEQAGLFCTCEKCVDRKEVPIGDGGLRPDLIIADESDMLKNASAGKTRRLLRYVSNHPHVIFIPMTGTMIDKSLHDFSHLLILALKERAPLPLVWHSLERWCAALDDNPKDGVRAHPGALLKLAPELPSDDNLLTMHEAADEGFRLRLCQTPGVIIDDEQSCDLPITIRLIKAPDDPILDQAFYHFRETKTTPDGYDVSGNFERTMHGVTLGCGFFNKPKVPPPQPWRDARRACHKAIQEEIKHSERRGRPIDTADQAMQRLKNHPDIIAWRAIEKSYKWESVPVWISASVLGFAAQWMAANGPALIWTESVPVGQALEAMTGVSYYGAAGLNRHGQLLDNADPRKSAIVSVDANMRGRNLWMWNLGLAISPPQPAKFYEQGILGRMHRTGQTKPVHLDIIISTADSLYALEKACSRARFIERKTKFSYKLLLATWDWTHLPLDELSRMPENDPRRSRWVRGDETKQPEVLIDLVA